MRSSYLLSAIYYLLFKQTQAANKTEFVPVHESLTDTLVLSGASEPIQGQRTVIRTAARYSVVIIFDVAVGSCP